MKIDKEACIGCGVCTSLCDEVFELADDGKAILTEKYKSGDVPDDIDCVDSAIESCAVEAISKE